MRAAPLSPVRRGWCPGLRRPMATGDGLLARLHSLAGALTVDQTRAVAAAARACGNGLVDVSVRGNLQIRGLTEASHGELVARLAAAGLGDERPDGPPRLTVTSPLAGLDPADRLDARALAVAIEAEGFIIEGLPAKLCIAVDGGGTRALDAVGADLHLVAVDGADSPLPLAGRGRGWGSSHQGSASTASQSSVLTTLTRSPGGDHPPHKGEANAGEVLVALGLASPDGPCWIGTTDPDSAPAAIAALLTAVAALRRSGVSVTRLRDLAPADRARLVAAVPLGPPLVPPPRRPAPKAGIVPLAPDRAAVLLALPFGRTDADGLDRIAAWSEHFGSGELRLSTWRGIAVPNVATADALILLAEARPAGFIVDSQDPRLAVVACPGAPACAAATTPTHADAAALAETARPLLETGLTLHVSGCAKGCAHPGPADLTLVGEAGAYGVVLDGTPRDAPVAHLPAGSIRDRLSTIRHPAGLRAAFEEIVR